MEKQTFLINQLVVLPSFFYIKIVDPTELNTTHIQKLYILRIYEGYERKKEIIMYHFDDGLIVGRRKRRRK